MPTVSVKLAEETKQRVQSLAQSRGVTAHAVMVQAIEAELSQQEDRGALVAAALRARAQVLASGKVLDGRAFSGYLQAKARGQSANRPKSIPVAKLVRGA